MIDWESQASNVLMNPCYTTAEKELFARLSDYNEEWPGHIWLSTSGSTVAKWVGLSKQAILASAQSVNAHLQSNSSDIWIQALPDFHAGGLGIWARGHLSGARVWDFKALCSKWCPASFFRFIEEKKGTLTALVPAQLHDLVQLGLLAPKSLRAVIIGGGKLSSGLYRKATSLNWKVLPSYGTTECASQIATAEIKFEQTEEPLLKILSHLKAKREVDGRLSFKGSSLLSTYAFFQSSKIEFRDPKIDGWLISEDKGEVNDQFIHLQGRVDHFIKIGGESVDFAQLESLLQDLRLRFNLLQDMALIAFPDDRLGSTIHLVIAGSSEKETLLVLEHFNNQVMPFERIRQVHQVPLIPRSALSKVLYKELLKLVCFS